MIKETPAKVADWLRANLEIVPPGDPRRSILERLANDDRMALLWDKNEAGGWPFEAQILLIDYAFTLAHEEMLSMLMLPPEQRIGPAAGPCALGAAADRLLEQIAEHLDDAARLWNGATGLRAELEPDPAPLNEMVERLIAFAERASAECLEFRAAFDDVPPPSRRGRGSRGEIAFRVALDGLLPGLPDVRLNQSQRDQTVARLAGVIFDREVDAQTVRVHRERQNRAIRRTIQLKSAPE